MLNVWDGLSLRWERLCTWPRLQEGILSTLWTKSSLPVVSVTGITSVSSLLYQFGKCFNNDSHFYHTCTANVSNTSWLQQLQKCKELLFFIAFYVLFYCESHFILFCCQTQQTVFFVSRMLLSKLVID